ncbi:hypothetical protein [Pedobacter alluvionis]|uniref:Uncharacterized protein n=1 Tax=Pedobacter alluvionis TaxID=475253 RepID=A0A497XN45_9SPHI|nr:hypothetical protein [Pedobacter alluvionis]RLJ69599.1 hypothetical protein BCL90_5197 [Pedobacter alluvionis]TFB28341.1 hypothetical protein E3V97_22925 [Pedobacter alluvionis]
MKFPLFLYYELLIRLTIFKPEIGEFQSALPFDDHVLLKTDKGMMEIPIDIMNMQFNDPELIPEQEIGKLAAAFRPYNEIDSMTGRPVSNAS